jgi:hypothetical protein
MRNVLAGLFAISTLILPCAAQADATASVTMERSRIGGMYLSFASSDCWQYNSSSMLSENGQQMCLVTVKVTIDPFTADEGLPGAFFIGARAGNQTIAVYSQNAWQPFHGGTIPPAAYFASIPSSLTTVVLDNQNLCAMSGDQPIEVWAGYGVLTPDKEEAIRNYHVIKNPSIPPDHLRNVYVQTNMRSNNKYWKVLDAPCLPPYSNSN